MQFSHWVRSNAEYPDYPYARFDVSLDRLSVAEDEWDLLDGEWGEIVVPTAHDAKNKDVPTNKTRKSSWTREETETLLALAHQHELRWPVIIDRWHARFNVGGDGEINTLSAQRRVEDLQHRYYHVGNVLARKRLQGAVAEINDTENVKSSSKTNAASNSEPQESTNPLNPSEKQALTALAQNMATHPSLVPNISLPNTGTTIQPKPFDLQSEKARRAHLNHVWDRPKAEEKEEDELRAELRAVELQLRKLKKSGKYSVPKGSAHSVSAAAVKTAVAGVKSTTERKAELDAYATTANNLKASFTATAPVPTPGTPYLQSGRLFPPALGGGLNKSTLKQMDEILAELNVKEPIATKRACDLYDEVRKEALTLLILQKVVLRKEAEVMSKRGKLVNVLGLGSGDQVIAEEKPETKKRKKSDADKQPAASEGIPPAGTTGTAKKTKTAGKTLSVGKNLPTAGVSKKKTAKKPSLPLTGASALAMSAPVGTSSVVNPLNADKATPAVTTTDAPAVSSKGSPQPTAAKTASIIAPPGKTGKKRGRPTKSPPAV